MAGLFTAGLQRLTCAGCLIALLACSNARLHAQDQLPAPPPPTEQPATLPSTESPATPPTPTARDETNKTVPPEAKQGASPAPDLQSAPSTTKAPPAKTGGSLAPVAHAEPGFDGKPEDSQKPVAVRIVTPKTGETLNENNADIFFSVDNYRLADGGNRLHVILDNNNPVSHADIRRPFIAKELPEGGHFIRVFAVAPDGRSFTNPDSAASTRFFIRKKDFQNFIGPNNPYLTVNLPVDGFLDIDGGDRIWFDFRTHNTPLTKGGDYFVHYRINNVEDYLQNDDPLYWQGLKAGRYELMVELVDKEKKLVPGPFNQVKRTFDLRISQKALPMNPIARPNSHNRVLEP
jgi:hypothetical protein